MVKVIEHFNISLIPRCKSIDRSILLCHDSEIQGEILLESTLISFSNGITSSYQQQDLQTLLAHFNGIPINFHRHQNLGLKESLLQVLRSFHMQNMLEDTLPQKILMLLTEKYKRIN